MARLSGKAGSRRARSKGGPNDLEDQAAKLVTVLDPMSPAAEAYRTLRTNLFYAVADTPPKVIVLTSPGSGEGKSTTCCNLGVVLAQAGKNTVIVDCDLRRPVVHKFFGLRNVHGLIDILVDARKVHETWVEPVEGLKVIPVGPIPPNPADILSSQRLKELLSDLRQKFDYVLVDAPPVGLLADAAILGVHGDGVLLVLDAQSTRKIAAQQSARSLEAVGARVLGTVMNNAKVSKGSYYYGYGYG